MKYIEIYIETYLIIAIIATPSHLWSSQKFRNENYEKMLDFVLIGGGFISRVGSQPDFINESSIIFFFLAWKLKFRSNIRY